MTRRHGHIRIGERWIGPGEPCYIIAEGGLNHNGDLGLAKKLVDAAHEAGVDAIKFQKRKLSEVYQQHLLDNPRRGEQGIQYLVPLLVEFELSDSEFAELSRYSVGRGITFFCTPWDFASVDLLENLGVPAYKIGSPDMTNLPLIEYVSRTRKPFLVSTGMSTEDEVRRSLAFLHSLDPQCGIFHCVSTYPAGVDEINLRFMQTLREWCEFPVGYSGHEEGLAVSLAAVALGATMLERHITLDRTMRGPDHKASLEPKDFRTLVSQVREVETALGVPHRWVSRGEILNRRALGKSLVAAADIPRGTTVTRDLIVCKSPGLGLSPQRMDEILGRPLNRDIGKDEPFLDSDLVGGTHGLGAPAIDLGLPWGIVARFQDLDALVGRFAPQGLSFVELHLSDRDLDAGLTAFSRKAYSLGLVIHAPEYCHDTLIDLCAEDRDQRQLSISRIQKTIDLTRELAPWFQEHGTRGTKVVVHVGGMARGDEYDREAAAERLLDSVRQLNRDHVDLLLENLPPYPWYFGGRWTGHMLVDADATRAICEATGLGLCFDTSHAGLACHRSKESLLDFARQVQSHIRHLHLADAAGLSGEGLQIGEGDVDFLDLWPVLAGTGATCVPEIWMGHHNAGSGFRTALDRLMETANAYRALPAAMDADRSALAKMIVPVDATLSAALRVIEANALGLVCVVDSRAVVVGVVTDGDIRRCLLAGHDIESPVEDSMNRDFVSATSDATESDLKARLSARCRVVPILDSARRLVGIATAESLESEDRTETR